MQLAVFTDLALRIVMRLAVLGDEESITTATLSEQLKVRYSHAAKVVAALRKLGVVDTRRGRAGGLWLTDEGKQASVGSIVRELEGDREVVDCDGVNPCPLRGGCRLRSALRKAQEAFFASLDAIQVSDLVAAPTRTVLLTLSPTPTS
ncbi:RrF2 family transcriptional regulator [Cumulibacter manganitolerans]|uniref:RrF2 family transcriptional regulator n=1 Tax=Cumulibacter manganitolerans TaxID=1884992 RepID=UPI001296AC90|nr:Rrf2 family transcriptional regulator [Cumulibacter manganitolerans]